MNNITDYFLKVMARFQSFGEAQTNIVFLLALQDYFNQRCDIRVLSSVATKLFYTFNKPADIEMYFDRDLTHALQEATELEFYVEDGKKELRSKQAGEEILKNLQKFYISNIHILDTFFPVK